MAMPCLLRLGIRHAQHAVGHLAIGEDQQSALPDGHPAMCEAMLLQGAPHGVAVETGVVVAFNVLKER